MPWDRKSKVKFFQERRKAAIKHFKDVGVPPRDAVKLGTKIASEQYQKYKAGFEKVNKMTDRIDYLIGKDKKTKKESKELDRLERQRQKLAQKTHETWKKWQAGIGYVEPSEGDIETVRKGT